MLLKNKFIYLFTKLLLKLLYIIFQNQLMIVFCIGVHIHVLIRMYIEPQGGQVGWRVRLACGRWAAEILRHT